jgi:Uncharacterized conserved protein (DUF2358)
LEVVDPSGFTLHGLRNYKQAFNLVHSIIHVFYCPEKSMLTFRIVFDKARNNIRVSWNSEVVPKAIFGGIKTTLHVDGISVYELDIAGKVIQHRVEHLMINDMPVETEQGIFHALKSTLANPDYGIPVFSRSMEDINTVRFMLLPLRKSFSLFEENFPKSLRSLNASPSGRGEAANDASVIDWEALEKKNKLRKKFGLEPLTPKEFLEIEAQVEQMQVQELSKQQALRSDATEVPRKKTKKLGFLSNLFGDALVNTCESNFDCVRPEICCDFGFRKMCCSSGAMVGRGVQQPVRIPITKDDGYYQGFK